MKTLYVRIAKNKENQRFWRCGIEFGQAWKKVSDLDDATAQRLKEEQMLEVTEMCPAELEEDAQAGDSAVAIVPAVELSVPPADAPVAVAEVIAVEAAPAEFVAPPADAPAVVAEVVAVEAVPVEVVAAPAEAPTAVSEVVAVEAAPVEAAAAKAASAKRTKAVK